MKKQVKLIVTGIGRTGERILKSALKKEQGIDGILVTVGLCIIALLLCVVMKNSLTTFITTLVNSMTQKAQQILAGTMVLPWN